MLAVCAVACESSNGGPSTHDASGDGTGSGTHNGVACGDVMTACTSPQPVCCDVMSGADTCIAENGTCAGRPLACDGPEDCPSTQECCLYDDRSRCLDTGICGTTGAITEVMCHVDGDCDSAAGEHCCGTAPGPVADVYGVCRVGGCPQ